MRLGVVFLGVQVGRGRCVQAAGPSNSKMLEDDKVHEDEAEDEKRYDVPSPTDHQPKVVLDQVDVGLVGEVELEDGLVPILRRPAGGRSYGWVTAFGSLAGMLRWAMSMVWLAV